MGMSKSTSGGVAPEAMRGAIAQRAHSIHGHVVDN